MLGLTRAEIWSVAVTAALAVIFIASRRSASAGKVQPLPALPAPPANVPAPSF